jgi:hypothetical protein
LTSGLFMSALVVADMGNGQYLMGLLMTLRLLLRLRISMPRLQLLNVNVKKKRNIRKEAHESRSSKEYAHNMAEWGQMAQVYNKNM